MRSADCLARRSGRADVGIGPYEKTGSGSVGADFISARAPPRRTHHRRTLLAPMPERAGSLVQRELAREARLATSPWSPRGGLGRMRSPDCLGPGGWRADVSIGPYKVEPSNPGGNRELPLF